MTKFGGWQNVAMGMNKLPGELTGAAMWGQQKTAELYVKIVKGHIDAQDLSWEPLDPSTNSGDPRILVDTEAFRLAIKAWRSGYKYNAGVPKDAVDHRGRSIADYAAKNEFGWGIIARPLFAPSYVDMGGAAGIKAMMSGAIYAKVARLKANGITVTI